jgi:hypothetical protein
MRSSKASGQPGESNRETHRRNLFHISEESDIARFEPRGSEYATGLVVWAIDEGRLCNYLVPRECPRVTYYAGADTTATDVDRFLGSSPAVVAIESGWLERVRSTWLYCYHMPPGTFECLDACAGYFVSSSAGCALAHPGLSGPTRRVTGPRRRVASCSESLVFARCCVCI